MNRTWDFIQGLLTLGLLIGIVAWLAWRSLRKSEEPLRLVWKWVITGGLLGYLVIEILPAVLQGGPGGAFMMPFVAAIAVVIGLIWAPNFGSWVSRMFTSLYDGGSEEPEPQAVYSIAEARRKQGRYAEAIAAIRAQLVHFPNDFPGQMLLAEILAENVNDLAGAEAVINAIVSQPNHARRNVAHALNTLADWQLRHENHAGAAHQTLRRVAEQFPDTEEAWLANQRIAHLGGGRHDPRMERPRLRLERHEGYLGLREDFAGLKIPERDAHELEAGYLRHLEDYPLDAGAREDLADLYAERLHRPDLAREQLEFLLAQPHLPSRQVVRWLDLLTDLHVHHTGNFEAARAAQQRIMDDFPKTAAAQNAMKRLSFLKLEMKGREQRQAIKLGAYEQNIGLKKGRPSGSAGGLPARTGPRRAGDAGAPGRRAD